MPVAGKRQKIKEIESLDNLTVLTANGFGPSANFFDC